MSLAALVGAALGITGAPAGAAEFGPISDVATLRDVIENQATDPSGDTVVLAPGTTFFLTCADGGGLLHDPATPLTIVGNGSTIELEDGCDDNVLEDNDAMPTVPGRVLRLENLTIRGGDITSGGDGGGVLTKNGIEIVGSTFTDNHVSPGTSSGGAVAAVGSGVIVDSVFTGNSSSGPGGAIRIQGGLTMERSTVSGNTGGLGGGGNIGGGISINSDSTITSSTISGNSAGEGDVGGGILFSDGTLTLVNSTVTGNTTNEFGGGVAGANDVDELVLVYSTIVGNTAADGANLAVGVLTSFASVVALPQGGANCIGDNPTTSFGYNVDDDDSCGFGDGPGDRPGFTGDLLLGALGDNGGPTQTLLPELTSPLVGAVPDAACQNDGASGLTTDQRGEPRPAPGLVGCDVGAVEVQLPPEPTPIVLTPTFTG